jgi:hypothetical protein
MTRVIGMTRGGLSAWVSRDSGPAADSEGSGGGRWSSVVGYATDTAAGITGWSASSASSIQKIWKGGGGGGSSQGGESAGFSGRKSLTASEVGDLIQPALQKVLAQ